MGKSDDLTILFMKNFFYYPSIRHVDTLIYLSISKIEQIYRKKIAEDLKIQKVIVYKRVHF